ncbi:MAG: DUF992 domain-containing protein [Hyphomicrobiaceae bacterium]
MRKFAVAIAAAMMGFVGAGQAMAQSKIEVGTLTCTGGEGVGLILGSKKSYRCSFAPVSGARTSYTATVTKIGLDIGVTGTTTMVWTVLASTSSVKRAMLVGTYAGAAADASIGVGGGAKVLVGGSSKSIVLQPLSVQGQTGVNLAVGVAALKLR